MISGGFVSDGWRIRPDGFVGMYAPLGHHSILSMAKTKAPCQNRINKAARSSSFCVISGGFVSGLGQMSA